MFIADTCTYRPREDPALGAKPEFAHAALSPYQLIAHCGNRTGNHREMLPRIR